MTDRQHKNTAKASGTERERKFSFYGLLSGIALAFMILLTAGTLSAQSPTFKVLPVQTVEAGQNFQLTFRLTNGEANAPRAPQLANCELLYGPSLSTRQWTEITNGRAVSSSIIDFTYTYRAKTPGTVTVPAISVTSGNTRLSTNKISFKILSADKNSASNRQQSHRQGAEQYEESAPPISAKDFFVRVSFSKSKAFEQEPIIATIKIYTKYGISNFVPKEQPTFNGFLSEELPVSGDVDRENVNGTNYYTAILKKCLLYPQKSGKLTVNAGRFDVTLRQYERVSMGYFVTNRPVDRTITTTSNTTSILVEPLPEPKPAGFTNAVGRFSVDDTLTPELLKTNEAGEYTYLIKGTGNIKFLSQPQINFPVGFDAYQPKTDIDAHVEGSNMTGTYKLIYTVVPQEVGKYTIEGTPFVYFNPDTRKYETITPKALTVNVAKGSATSAAVEQKEIVSGMQDILHIKPTADEPQEKNPTYIIGSVWYISLYFIAAVILICVIAVYRRKVKLRADVAGRKLAKANSVAAKRLRVARGYMSGATKDSEKFYQALSSAIWGYVSDKLGIPASGLTRDNIAEKLQAKGADEESVANIISVLDTCEMARFTPMNSDSEIDEVYRQAAAAIKEIENAGSKRSPQKASAGN